MTGQPATPSELGLLEALGCLPPVDCSLLHVENENVLPGLVELWTLWRQTAPRNRRDRAVRVECWLRASAAQGAVLTARFSAQPPKVTDD